MQRLVSVSDVEALVQQRRRQVLATGPMSANGKALVLRFIPRVHTALIMQPRLCLSFIVRKHGKCWNAVFTVVLELVVPPNDAEIRLELIERPSRHPKAVNHGLAMLVRMRLPAIRSPLPPHRLGPVVEAPQGVRQRRLFQTYFDTAGQVSLHRKTRIMRDAEPKYLSHRFLLAGDLPVRRQSN